MSPYYPSICMMQLEGEQEYNYNDFYCNNSTELSMLQVYLYRATGQQGYGN